MRGSMTENFMKIDNIAAALIGAAGGRHDGR
jgi:hypothetical protein